MILAPSLRYKYASKALGEAILASKSTLKVDFDARVDWWLQKSGLNFWKFFKNFRRFWSYGGFRAYKIHLKDGAAGQDQGPVRPQPKFLEVILIGL